MVKEWPVINVDQVWRDRDKRSMNGNRHVKVLGIEHGLVRITVVYVAVSPNGRQWPPAFRSRYDRFQKRFELTDQTR